MKRGQGLLETTVAIGVITTGLIAVISLVVSNLTTARETALRYQAMNFAREGVELLRNMRDSNWLLPAEDGAWSSIAGQGANLVFEFVPGTDVVALRPDVGMAGSTAREIQRCDSGVYGQGSVSCLGAGFFSRTLTITPRDCRTIFADNLAVCTEAGAPDPIALDVLSRVTWLDRGGERKVELTARLYDWR